MTVTSSVPYDHDGGACVADGAVRDRNCSPGKRKGRSLRRLGCMGGGVRRLLLAVESSCSGRPRPAAVAGSLVARTAAEDAGAGSVLVGTGEAPTVVHSGAARLRRSLGGDGFGGVAGSARNVHLVLAPTRSEVRRVEVEDLVSMARAVVAMTAEVAM